MSLQSLSIGVSGLRSHQTRLDTVSNNIANSSTTAFKRQRAAFSEELGQAILGVGRTAGGSNINPSKVGRGVSVASIDRNFSQGSLNDTGIKTDLALNGDGFFVASPKSGAASDQRRLTRAGNFTFNQGGELVTANGLNVQGWEVGEDGTANTGELKNVQFDPNAQSAAKATTEAEVGGNLSADAEVGDTSEISSVVYDEQGKAHNVVINFENTSEDTWTFSVEDPDGVLQDANGGGPGDANGTITFKDDGSVDSISGMTNAYDPDGNGTNDGVSLDWTNDAVQGGKSLGISLRDITQFSGSTTSKFQGQNGNSSGELSGVQFTPEGKLQLNYTNGVQEEEYQLAIGDVNNPNGLEQQGENFFTTTGASGDLQLGRAGRDLQTSVVSGALESSNVDLAKEFSDLIKAQRSYQASSQIITTADEVLNQTVQLKR